MDEEVALLARVRGANKYFNDNEDKTTTRVLIGLGQQQRP